MLWVFVDTSTRFDLAVYFAHLYLPTKNVTCFRLGFTQEIFSLLLSLELMCGMDSIKVPLVLS